MLKTFIDKIMADILTVLMNDKKRNKSGENEDTLKDYQIRQLNRCVVLLKKFLMATNRDPMPDDNVSFHSYFHLIHVRFLSPSPSPFSPSTSCLIFL